MEEVLKKLVALLQNYFLKKQQYEWRFYQFNGKESNKQLKIANSIEYEFINSGNSYVFINDTLKLYPAFMGIEPTRVRLVTNKNEVDTGVYEYRFQDIAAGDPVQRQDANGAWQLGSYNGNGDAKPAFNLLQVVVKQVSR